MGKGSPKAVGQTVSGLGLGLAIAANGWWGMSPIFWKQLSSVAAFDAVAHRVVWSAVLLALVHTLRGRWSEFLAVARKPRNLGVGAASSMMLFANWSIFVWAVGEGRVIESALGYFLNPLVSVLLGRVVFAEKLRPVQLVSVVLAAIGVVWLTVDVGTLPWVALSLGVSFGIYGAIRKSAAFEALDGLSLEVGFLVVPLFLYLFVQQLGDAPTVDFAEPRVVVFLLLTSVVTTVPLVAFARAVRLVPLSVVGIIQYLNPTLQFLVGVVLYNEAFEGGQVLGYSIIWVAVAIFAAESSRHARRTHIGNRKPS